MRGSVIPSTPVVNPQHQQQQQQQQQQHNDKCFKISPPRVFGFFGLSWDYKLLKSQIVSESSFVDNS